MNKKIKSLLISIILISMISVIHEVKPAYAGAAVQYSDGAGNTAIAACSSPTTLGSVSTSFPAGNNLIIASVQATSTNAPNKDVTVTINRSGTLATNQYPIQVGASATQNNYMLLYKDVGAPANPTYTVTGCRSFAVVDAETKLIALSGFEQNGFVDGSSTAITTGADRTVATVSPTIIAGDNIIIASIQIDNGGTAQIISAGSIKLKNGAGTTLTSNEFSMQFGTGTPTDIQAITLIYVETGAAQNPTYTVTINPAQNADAEAKILVFQSTKIKYVDGSSTAVGNTATVLATTTSTFSSENIVEISASEFDDTGATIETYTASTGNEIREGTTAVAGNQYALQAFAAGGNTAGDGHRHYIIDNIATSGTNQSYEVRAVESANNAQNGASQLVVFKVASPLTPLFPSDMPSLTES